MLTDLIVRQAKAIGKPYAIADFAGLSLYVPAAGSKAWHFRYSWGGKRYRISFGNYPALSLKDAREKRDKARELLAQGINPKQNANKRAGTSSERSPWQVSTASRPYTNYGLPTVGFRWKKDGRPASRKSSASSRKTCFRR